LEHLTWGGILAAPGRHKFTGIYLVASKQNTQQEGVPMKSDSLKTVRRSILLAVTAGLTLMLLVGCGIGHGPYRHGYDGRNGYNNTNYYRSGNDSGSTSYTTNDYVPGNRGYGPMNGDSYGRRGYCAW
jgi:hypothetical protein